MKNILRMAVAAASFVLRYHLAFHQNHIMEGVILLSNSYEESITTDFYLVICDLI